MAFGIIRVRNLHMADLPKAQKHNNREYAPEELPKNIHPDGYFSHTTGASTTIEDAVMKRIEGVPIRKNSVVAIEYVCAISAESMKKMEEDYSQTTILQFCKKFVEQKHGEENIVSYSIHFDESNPHVHVIAVPLEEKKIKWKNTKGQGEKIEKRLCARDFTGDKDKLRQLQTDYYDHLTSSDSYYSEVWKRYNIEFRRGEDARVGKKYYSKMTNHVIGDVLSEIKNTKLLYENKKISIEELISALDTSYSKMESITDNVERKAVKDHEKWEKGLRWTENTPEFGV